MRGELREPDEDLGRKTSPVQILRVGEHQKDHVRLRKVRGAVQCIRRDLRSVFIGVFLSLTDTAAVRRDDPVPFPGQSRLHPRLFVVPESVSGLRL